MTLDHKKIFLAKVGLGIAAFAAAIHVPSDRPRMWPITAR
jgi:hypothetical protein